MPETGRIITAPTGCTVTLNGGSGIFMCNFLDAEGRAVLVASTRDGRRVAERALSLDGTVPEWSDAVQELRSLLDVANARLPVTTEAPPPLPALRCLDGGNRPARGRRRARASLTVTSGGLASRRTGRRA